MSTTDLTTFDPSLVEQSADPGTFVVLACERAKDWLEQAVAHGEIDQIVEIKSQAEAIRIYSTQKQLGKDAELAAAEIVRRAERGLGVSIRRGQEEGTVSPPNARSGNSRPGKPLARPSDYASDSELYGGGHGLPGIYDLADDVDDDQFEAALGEAKNEGNLTRTNVAKKVATKKASAPGTIDRTASGIAKRLTRIRELAEAGHLIEQIAADVGMNPAYTRELCRANDIRIPDDVIGKTRKIDPDRLINELVTSLEGSVTSLDFITSEFDQIDRSQLDYWTSSLTESLRSLNRFNKRLKEMTE